MTKTHLLIDADVIAFSCAAAVQHLYVSEENGWAYPIANTAALRAVIENTLLSIKAGLSADTFELVLTDPKENWRSSVDPHYKANRSAEDGVSMAQRPILLNWAKDYLRENHGAYHWPGLEADDVLSWKMTRPEVHLLQGGEAVVEDPGSVRLICVGRDKDFQTIPGLHHTWKKDLDASGKMLVREVSPWEADRFHLIQTLAGDRVDGFAGCPNIGMKRAAEIIDNPVILVPQEGVITRGVNKGSSTTKWVSEPTRDLWAAVVSQYRKAGLGEAEALVSARLARLLRYGEYDPETEELTLWTPELLKQRG